MLKATFKNGTELELDICYAEPFMVDGKRRETIRLCADAASQSLAALEAIYRDARATETILLTNDELPVVDPETGAITGYETIAKSYTEFTIPMGIGIDEDAGHVFMRLGQLSNAEVTKPLVFELISGLPDDAAAEKYAMLFDKWQIGATYKKGDRREFNGWLFKCLQDHTAEVQHMPDTAVSMWANIADPGEEYPLIDNPIQAESPWMKDEKGRTADGRKWVSLLDNNVWQPNEYPKGWKEEN